MVVVSLPVVFKSSHSLFQSCYCGFNYAGMKRTQAEVSAKKIVCRKYIIYAYDVDMNIKIIRLKRKCRISRRTPSL